MFLTLADLETPLALTASPAMTLESVCGCCVMPRSLVMRAASCSSDISDDKVPCLSSSRLRIGASGASGFGLGFIWFCECNCVEKGDNHGVVFGVPTGDGNSLTKASGQGHEEAFDNDLSVARAEVHVAEVVAECVG